MADLVDLQTKIQTILWIVWGSMVLFFGLAVLAFYLVFSKIGKQEIQFYGRGD